MAPTLAGVKLDLVTKNYESVSETMAKMPVIPPHPQSVASLGMSRTTSGKTRTTSAASSQKAKTPATMKTYEMPIQPLVGILVKHIFYYFTVKVLLSMKIKCHLSVFI